MIKLVSIAIVVALVLLTLSAEAAPRVGGGRSVGQQSTNVTNKTAAPPAVAAKPAAPTVATAAPPGRPWGAMLGGVAAGMGMAWLAHSLGLGSAMGSVLMFVLLGLAVCAVVWWMQRRSRRHESGPVV